MKMFTVTIELLKCIFLYCESLLFSFLEISLTSKEGIMENI